MDTPHVPENQYFISAKFRRAAARVHRIGPRAVTELLAEAGVPIALIEKYAALDEYPRAFLEAAGAINFPPTVFIAVGGRP